jgi:putative endonuclease
MNIRQLLGQSGEREAVRVLKKNGCRIIERNYRNPFGEIDIIALDRGTIVFIEVKTRNETGLKNPKEAVTIQKQKRMIKTAEAWMKKNLKKADAKARFDVIAIVKRLNNNEIEWVKNAFDNRYF